MNLSRDPILRSLAACLLAIPALACEPQPIHSTCEPGACPPDGRDGGGGGASGGGGGGAGEGGGGAGGGPPVLVPFEPAFDTGFEADEALGCEGDPRAPTCGETSLAHDALLFFPKQPSTDWRTWDLAHPESGVSILYEVDAPASARSARLVDDPTRPGNRVLHLQITDATIPAGYQGHLKGRVQTQTGFEPPITELYFRQRIYLHPDLGKLLTYPASGDPWWLGIVIQEMRAGSPSKGDPHSFLMDVQLLPDVEGQAFRLAIQGKKAAGAGAWESVWLVGDDETEVPLGAWLTLETAYRQGACCDGRFAVALWDDAGRPLVSLDVEGFTYSPDASSPVALDTWNGPQKLYASDNVLHHIRDQGGSAQLYFDDFAIGPGWPDSWSPPPSTATFAQP